MNLSVLMRAALEAAQREPLRRVHDNTPGAPAWPAHPCTLHALERHELVIRAERLGRRQPDGTTNRIEEWTITTHGSLALNPPPKVIADRPVYLAPSSGTTSNPHRSIDRDSLTGQALETMEPDERWAAEARVRHAAAQSRRDRAKRLRAA